MRSRDELLDEAQAIKDAVQRYGDRWDTLKRFMLQYELIVDMGGKVVEACLAMVPCLHLKEQNVSYHLHFHLYLVQLKCIAHLPLLYLLNHNCIIFFLFTFQVQCQLQQQPTIRLQRVS